MTMASGTNSRSEKSMDRDSCARRRGGATPAQPRGPIRVPASWPVPREARSGAAPPGFPRLGTRRRSGTPARGGSMPSVAGLAGGLVAAAALAAGAPGGEMVEMEVLGVLPLEDGQASLLVLAQKDGQAVLTPVIDRPEANAIELALRHVTPPRPMTHD